MRSVMLNAMKLCANLNRRSLKRPSQIFVNSREPPHHPRAIQRKLRHAHRESQLRSQPRPRVAWDSNVVHFRKFYARLVQAMLNCAHRKPRRILHAVQALFFHSRQQPSVRNNRRRGVGVVSVNAQDDHPEYCGGNSSPCLTNKLKKYVEVWDCRAACPAARVLGWLRSRPTRGPDAATSRCCRFLRFAGDVSAAWIQRDSEVGVCM